MNVSLVWMLCIGIWTAFLFTPKPLQKPDTKKKATALVYGVEQDGFSPANTRQLNITFNTVKASFQLDFLGRVCNDSFVRRHNIYFDHFCFSKTIRCLIYAPLFIYVRCLRL